MSEPAMITKKKILAIIGSTRASSSNLSLIKEIAHAGTAVFEITLYKGISSLPHFNPDLDQGSPPLQVKQFRQLIQEADAVLICTPEYILSLPGSLKNAIEWCVSTTVFSAKPAALITASASGDKAHEELQLIMKTVETVFTADTTWLIKGIKGKFNAEDKLTDEQVRKKMHDFIQAFNILIETNQK